MMNFEEAQASFSNFWTRTRRQIEAELNQRIPRIFAADPGPELDAITRAVDGGKRIRGCLVCLMCNALGGTTESAVPRAVAIECVQAASLIHDDYIDEDHTRRERPAGWVVDGSRRAVLVGDVMFATAIEQMASNGTEEGVLIARTIADMARGAYLEQTNGRALGAVVSGQRYEYVATHYDEIIRLKTAALFAAAAEFGAIAAAASAKMRQKAFNFGMSLGKAYQLADDLADIVKFQNRSEVDTARMIEIAPMMMRFSEDRSPALEHLNVGNLEAFGAWILSETPVVHDQVIRTIANLQRTSASILAGLPDNQYKGMLHEMPVEVTKAAR